jgi:hypothetical protein
LQDLQKNDLEQAGVTALLGESDKMAASADGLMVASTKVGFKHGKDKPINEDGVILLNRTMILLDGMSSGGKGAAAVRAASEPMSHHANKGVNPSKLMQLGTQKLASVAKEQHFDLDQDGAAAVVVKDTGTHLEGAVVADCKLRIWDVTINKLAFSSGDQSIAGDVETALEGTDADATLYTVNAAANEGAYMGWGTIKKLRQVVNAQLSGTQPEEALRSEIGAKVRARLAKNPITSSLNPRGEMDQPPLPFNFPKEPGHKYLALVHSDGLVLDENEIAQELQAANGDIRNAARRLKRKNEEKTAGERQGDGYVDDATFGIMAA